MELRCPNHQLFGRLDTDEKTVEVMCRNKLCGYGPGKVVLHYFDSNTGEFIKTETFYDPQRLFLQGRKPKEETKCH